VEGATSSTLEPGTVEENACAIDSSSHGVTGLVPLEEPCFVSLVLELPILRGEFHGGLHDSCDILFVDEVCAERAAPLVEVLGRLFENTLATLSEYALPRGSQEGGIEHPSPLLSRVLEGDHLVKIEVASGESVDGNAASFAGHPDRLKAQRVT
jgi:hypothetical protein